MKCNSIAYPARVSGSSFNFFIDHIFKKYKQTTRSSLVLTWNKNLLTMLIIHYFLSYMQIKLYMKYIYSIYHNFYEQIYEKNYVINEKFINIFLCNSDVMFLFIIFTCIIMSSLFLFILECLFAGK